MLCLLVMLRYRALMFDESGVHTNPLHADHQYTGQLPLCNGGPWKDLEYSAERFLRAAVPVQPCHCVTQHGKARL